MPCDRCCGDTLHSGRPQTRRSWCLAVAQSKDGQSVEVVTQDERKPLHTTASLRCSLKSSQEPLIVTWQKKKAVGPENMVTYSKAHGVVIQPAYRGRINITELGLWNSSITFWNTTLDDEGCYMCLFNMFGSGKVSGTACLTLSAHSTPSLQLFRRPPKHHLLCNCPPSPCHLLEGHWVRNRE